MKHRNILPILIQKINKGKNHLILIGARQVGKTTIMKMLYKHFADLYGKNLLFINLEDEIILSQLYELPNSLFPRFLNQSGIDMEKPALIFIDEIQYLKRPTRILKYLADEYPLIKVVASGSSSLAIFKKLEDSLVGRKKIFVINPLSFQEFLHFKQSRQKEYFSKLKWEDFAENKIKPQEIEMFSKSIFPLWQEYLIYGGYHKVALQDKREEKISELSEIYNSYIKKDVKDIMRVENVAGFNRLLRVLSFQIGNLAVFSELSSSVKISLPTLENYLVVLQETFIIKLLSPFFTNKRKEIIKSPKIFFLDTGLRNIVSSNFQNLEQRGDKGHIVENWVLQELNKNICNKPLFKLNYWRKITGAEVDFVMEKEGVKTGIEVKAKSLSKPTLGKGTFSFIRTYQPKTLFVFNQSLFAKRKVEKTDIWFLPLWLAPIIPAELPPPGVD